MQKKEAEMQQRVKQAMNGEFGAIINLSNGIYAVPIEQNMTYKFYIGSGNNGALIKMMLH
jgi:putative component of toxin-antitoxin plasmid stabilization module